MYKNFNYLIKEYMDNHIQTYEELIVLVHPLFLNCTTLNMLNTEEFRISVNIVSIVWYTHILPLPSLLRFGFSMILPPLTKLKENNATNNIWYNIFGFPRLTGSFLALQNYLSTCSVNQEVKELMSCCRLNKKTKLNAHFYFKRK